MEKNEENGVYRKRKPYKSWKYRVFLHPKKEKDVKNSIFSVVYIAENVNKKYNIHKM